MKNYKKENNPKRLYIKPNFIRIDLDNEISMVMLSEPPGDPDSSIQPDHFCMNPFKLPKL